MKKLKFLSILLVLCALIGTLAPSAFAAEVEEAPAVSSAAIYLADSETGYVYFERNSTNRVYPASLTKIMTALLVVEAVERGELSLEEEVTAQEGFAYDMIDEGSTASIVLGETMSLENMLHCTLLASANEACNILAMRLCGTIDKFVAKMNERALELGCIDTHFANPHGLPNENHYTTAYDMFLIAQEAMTHEIFATICDKAEATVSATNKSGTRALINTNGLITSDGIYKGYYYEPAIGIKTGYTSAAGYCLISSALQSQINPICVVMGGVMTESANGALDYSNYSDSIKLYKWVFSNYTRMELVEEESDIITVPVKLGSDADTLSLVAQQSVTGVLRNDADLTQLETKITIYSEEHDQAVKAPISSGQVLGEVTVSLDGVEYGKTYLVANRSVDLSYLSAMLDTIFSTLSNPIVLGILLVLLLAAGAYGAIVIRYRINFHKQQRELEEAKIQRQKLQEQAERDRMMAEARRRSYRSDIQTKTPPSADVTRDYFEEFFND